MYDEKHVRYLVHAQSKIALINEIIKNYGYVTLALEDITLARPAILMHLTAFAEQFDKLKKSNATEILSKFDEKDLKGTYDVRTYIAHDYEGVNLAVIESVIKNKLPTFEIIIAEILGSVDSIYYNS